MTIFLAHNSQLIPEDIGIVIKGAKSVNELPFGAKAVSHAPGHAQLHCQDVASQCDQDFHTVQYTVFVKVCASVCH